MLLTAGILIFVGLRIFYHGGLAAVVRSESGTSSEPSLARSDRPAVWRTQLGAALLPLNPLTGLLLGWTLQSVFPWSPYALAWAFLPFTLLGIALLGGSFGLTAWSPRRLPA
jgi:hypothetical protein